MDFTYQNLKCAMCGRNLPGQMMIICVSNEISRDDSCIRCGRSALCPEHHHLVGSLLTFSSEVEVKKQRTLDSSAVYCKDLNVKLWESKPHADCRIIVRGETIHCHRNILAAASPVMQRMLESGMKEAHECKIEIQDAEPGDIQAMVRFAYLGELDTKQESMDAIFLLSDQYEMPILLQHTARAMLDKLACDNAPVVAHALRKLADRKEIKPFWDEFKAKLQEDEALLEATLQGM